MIKINNLSVGNRLVVSELTIKSSKYALFGPNGAGKSTLLKAMADLEMFGGSIVIDGSVSYCGDINSIDSDMLVCEILHYARGSKSQDTSLLNELVEHFKLGEFLNRSLSSLSSGERQRVNLVSSFYLQSTYILLDEPTNYLDPIYVDILSDYLSRLKCGVVIVSHDLNFLCQNTTMALGIVNGEIVTNNKLVEAISQRDFDKVFSKEYTYQTINSRSYIL